MKWGMGPMPVDEVGPEVAQASTKCCHDDTENAALLAKWHAFSKFRLIKQQQNVKMHGKTNVLSVSHSLLGVFSGCIV